MEEFISKAKAKAERLYAIDPPESYPLSMLLGSLQGLAANSSEEQIIVKVGAYELYRSALKKEFKCRIIERDEQGRAYDVLSLVKYFSDVPDGYILIPDDPASPAAPVAITLAHHLNALVVTESIADSVKSSLIPELLDARSLDERWLRSSKYWEMINKKTAVEQPAASAPKLVDYAVMAGCYFGFSDSTDRLAHTEKFSFLEPGAVVFGWNNVLGEYDTVGSFSSLNVCLVPADHAFNLSTLSSFAPDTLFPKYNGAAAYPEKHSGGISGILNERINELKPSDKLEDEDSHSVCFIMSDGDNLQWLLNGFASSENWFGSPLRGKFPLGWGMCGTALDIASPMLSYLYGAMSKNDEFILQLSGRGYTFPSLWKPSELEKMILKLSLDMKRMGIGFAEVLDDDGFKPDLIAPFLSRPEIKALFYIDYWNYAGMCGDILWHEGKPAISAKYRLWATLPDGEIDAVANSINNSSVNRRLPGSYSFVIVHCWSGLDEYGNLVPDGNTMQALDRLVSKFNKNVRVLSPADFVNKMIKNLQK